MAREPQITRTTKESTVTAVIIDCNELTANKQVFTVEGELKNEKEVQRALERILPPDKKFGKLVAIEVNEVLRVMNLVDWVKYSVVVPERTSRVPKAEETAAPNEWPK